MTATALPYLMVDDRGPGRRLVLSMLCGGAKQYIINVEPPLSGYLVRPQPSAVACA